MPQDSFPLLEPLLKDLVREEREITVYLMNGFQIKGVLKAYDHSTLLVSSRLKEQLIFKHAVSTIAPTDNNTLLTRQAGPVARCE